MRRNSRQNKNLEKWLTIFAAMCGVFLLLRILQAFNLVEPFKPNLQKWVDVLAAASIALALFVVAIPLMGLIPIAGFVFLTLAIAQTAFVGKLIMTDYPDNVGEDQSVLTAIRGKVGKAKQKLKVV